MFRDNGKALQEIPVDDHEGVIQLLLKIARTPLGWELGWEDQVLSKTGHSDLTL